MRRKPSETVDCTVHSTCHVQMYEDISCKGGSRTRISIENHVFLFFAVVEMSFTPAKTVMVAALLSSFLGFPFSVGQVDVFASRSVHEEELIPTTAKSSMHCKKGYRFSIPQAGCHWPNSPWPGIIKFFPAREGLVTSRLGAGKSMNFFYSVVFFTHTCSML